MIEKFAAPLINAPTSLPQVSADESRIASIVVYLSVLGAAISVLIIVIAGIQFIIASGEPTKIAKARSAILYAVVGLIVTLSAGVIASVVARSV